MRIYRLSLSCAALLFASLFTGNARAAETLTLAGTGGAMPMAEVIADAYDAATGTRIEVIFGVGSGGAIRALGDGAIDLAISSRPLKPGEAELGLTAIAIARTPLVFVTSQGEPDSLASTELAAIYASPDSRWSDGSPIKIILRPESDGDTALVEEAFPGMQAGFEAARLRPEIPVEATDQDSAKAAEELQGSLVQAGYSQIVTERRDLRFVPIDGVAPTLDHFEAGDYLYEKVFYLVYSEAGKVGAEGLLGFLRSAEGQDTLRASGSLPAAE